MMSKFNRGLSPEFIHQLDEEAKKNSWWADVLNDPKLFVAVRKEYLNVYWRGQSLFRVAPGLSVTTHVKFLVDPKLADQVSLIAGEFKIGELRERGFISQYKGPETLAKLKTAAGLFSGLEKTGCHEIAVGKSPVIDCEIAFGYDDDKTAPSVDPPSQTDAPARGVRSGAPRADLATLEPEGDGGAHLVFWEAKHFDNSELRARAGRPVPIWNQVKAYREYISGHRDQIMCSYTKVAANLVAIDLMRQEPYRRLSPLIGEVAANTRKLTLGKVPKVGLVIFGFDKAERDDLYWKADLARLAARGKSQPSEDPGVGISLAAQVQ
jgi:hypothetical protein